MGKRSKRSKRRQYRRKAPKEPRRGILAKTLLLLRPIRILGGLSVAAGLMGFYYTLAPSVAISITDKIVNPADPFSAHFVIENLGILPINEVRVGCSVPLLVTESVTFTGNPELYFGRPNDGADVIPAKARQSFQCSQSVVVSADGKTVTVFPQSPRWIQRTKRARIKVVATFRGQFIPWQNQVVSSFETASAADGQMHWIPLPLGTSFKTAP